MYICYALCLPGHRITQNHLLVLSYDTPLYSVITTGRGRDGALTDYYCKVEGKEFIMRDLALNIAKLIPSPNSSLALIV